jgi:dCMP deaminase
MRPSIYETFAIIVSALAGRSTCSRAKVGALLFDDKNRIIATGYNGSPRGFPHCDDVGCVTDTDGHCISTIHAEENALLQCAVVGRSTAGLMLFTTHSPCAICALRLIQAEISRIVYMQPYGSRVKYVDKLFYDHDIIVDWYHGWKEVK